MNVTSGSDDMLMTQVGSGVSEGWKRNQREDKEALERPPAEPRVHGKDRPVHGCAQQGCL